MWRSPPPSQLSVDQKLGQSEENGAKNKDEGVKMCVKSNIENEPVECTGTVSPPENATKIAANKRGEGCAFFPGTFSGKIKRSKNRPKKNQDFQRKRASTTNITCKVLEIAMKIMTRKSARPRPGQNFQLIFKDFRSIFN